MFIDIFHEQGGTKLYKNFCLNLPLQFQNIFNKINTENQPKTAGRSSEEDDSVCQVLWYGENTHIRTAAKLSANMPLIAQVEISPSKVTVIHKS